MSTTPKTSTRTDRPTPLPASIDDLAVDHLERLGEATQSRVDALVQRYGVEADVARRTLRTLETAQDEGAPFLARARDRLTPGAEKVREGVSELAEGLRDVGAEARSELGDAAKHGREQLGEAAHRARDAASSALEQGVDGFRHGIDRAGRFVQERPFTSLAIAFAAGWLLMGRRR